MDETAKAAEQPTFHTRLKHVEHETRNHDYALGVTQDLLQGRVGAEGW